MSELEITFLGTGTSQGVPVIACSCPVCQSQDPRDKRTRSSIMFSVNGENYVVDTGPDFRAQMLREDVQSLRAILYTHEHKDHVAGMDDVRAFNYKEQRDMEIFCSERVEEALIREFYYVFESVKYPGVPVVNINRIENKVFTLPCGEEIIPVEVMHYKMPVLGFRIKDFTYITDAKTVAESELEKVKGSKVLVVNALRKNEHISHFNLEEALAFIEKVNPEMAYLTHISHLFESHEEIERELPENVRVAYDGLKINL
ncbi:MAG: MBL fold metallo-hydrolase [Crocinitomicaceae bacterium]